jgi:threonine/homoserine/homoserine lactone efflux protein
MFIWSSIAYIIALTSPGPDTAVTIRQVTFHGRAAGYYTALGIGVGVYLHCLLAINGISLFILQNDLYKLLISLIGSLYIFYLGISMLITYLKPELENDIPENNSSNYSSFFSGLITNIFNIKAFIFFVSLFTILIDSIQGILFYIYPIYFAITTALWFALVSFLITTSRKINIYKNKYISYFLSIILCLIGLFIFIKSIYEYF